MNLLAKTNKKTQAIGKKDPIPFSETAASPDNVSKRYTIEPNNKKFNNMLSLFITNCNCLFLYRKMVMIDNIAEMINENPISLISVESCVKVSIVNKSSSFFDFQSENTNESPPEIPAEINKNKD
jgi:hypothetical protein